MMKGGMGNMMKQAQQMQEKMQQIQAEVDRMEVTGEAGAGLVRLVMTGRHDVKSVSLDDSLMQEDKELLEDLLAAAVNDAVRKVDSASKERMSSVTAGMGLPPGMKLQILKPGTVGSPEIEILLWFACWKFILIQFSHRFSSKKKKVLLEGIITGLDLLSNPPGSM